MEAPKPGIYEGIPSTDYHRWEAVNASLLKTVREKSPMHARYEQLHPKDQTPAMAMGEAIHYALLEPELFTANVVPGLDHDRRSAANKAAWLAFEEDNSGKVIIKQAEFDRLDGLHAELLNHNKAGALLQAPGRTEVSLVWEVEGVLCKGRYDRLCREGGHNWVIDVKSCQDASPRGFQRQVANYLYDLQAAHYLGGAHALDPDNTYRFAFVAVEKDPPYGAAVYEASPTMLFEGGHKARTAMEAWAKCVKAGRFTGYPGGVQTLELPRYAEVADREMDAAEEGL